MLSPIYTKSFNKDIKRVKKRGKATKKLKEVIVLLLEKKKLLPKYKDHKLEGNFASCRECHIEPDWLLIYKTQEQNLFLVRTGTHSDLFK